MLLKPQSARTPPNVLQLWSGLARYCPLPLRERVASEVERSSTSEPGEGMAFQRREFPSPHPPHSVWKLRSLRDLASASHHSFGTLSRKGLCRNPTVGRPFRAVAGLESPACERPSPAGSRHSTARGEGKKTASVLLHRCNTLSAQSSGY